jgi:hypothetical protein
LVEKENGKQLERRQGLKEGVVAIGDAISGAWNDSNFAAAIPFL